MRMTGAVVLGTIIIQVLLGGAFALGFFWLEGWRPGLLFAGIMLLLIVLPWPGELKVVFDSEGPRGAVVIGWWGKVSFNLGPAQPMAIIRILGIPFRRRIEPKKKPEEAADERTEEEAEAEAPSGAPAAEEDEAPEDVAESEDADAAEKVKRFGRWCERLRLPEMEKIEGFSRIAGSALNAGNDLIWGADEIRVWVHNPSEKEMADAAIEQVIGSRGAGPVHLIMTAGSGGRRVRALYRISLLRAALAGAQMALDGRAMRFARTRRKKSDEPEIKDQDQRIIEDIRAQQEAEE